MYAIIKCGSKQHRVSKDQIIDVDLIAGEPGSVVEFSEVLFVSGKDGKLKFGEPTVSNCMVKAEVIGMVKGPKIDSVKYKQRKRQYRHWGHRQKYSRVKITEIAL